MIGKTISHYQIVEKLGEGGTGVAYKARDTGLDRLVAVKVLQEDKLAAARPETASSARLKRSLLLNHPHICTLHQVKKERGSPPGYETPFVSDLPCWFDHSS